MLQEVADNTNTFTVFLWLLCSNVFVSYDEVSRDQIESWERQFLREISESKIILKNHRF